MKRLRLCAAVLVSKLIYIACKLRGTRASAAPGKYACKICPDLIDIFAKKVRKGIVIVCGTNGKTTTNNLVNTAFLSEGYKTVCNNAGANMMSGVAAAFCKKAGWLGTLDADYACLEVDEANLRLLFKHLTPTHIVVTNLFRDQIDRYGEVDSTFMLLKEAFDMVGGAKLVLNADDPVTSLFGEGRESVYYASEGNVDIKKCREAAMEIACPKCGKHLSYEYRLYDKIGKYECECGYKNQNAQYVAKNVVVKEGELRFDIDFAGETYAVKSEAAGLYNVYNMLMAAAVLDDAGVLRKTIASTICSQKPEPGRMSRFCINGKNICLMLSKNPAGFNQSVMAVINDERKKDVLFAVNTTPADGEDISWLWDVDFEAIKDANAESYTVTGGRKYDMYLRLKYGGFDEKNINICDGIDEAIDNLLAKNTDICYLLVNYSAMYPAYKKLEELEKGSDGK